MSSFSDSLILNMWTKPQRPKRSSKRRQAYFQVPSLRLLLLHTAVNDSNIADKWRKHFKRDTLTRRRPLIETFYETRVSFTWAINQHQEQRTWMLLEWPGITRQGSRAATSKLVSICAVLLIRAMRRLRQIRALYNHCQIVAVTRKSKKAVVTCAKYNK